MFVGPKRFVKTISNDKILLPHLLANAAKKISQERGSEVGTVRVRLANAIAKASSAQRRENSVQVVGNGGALQDARVCFIEAALRASFLLRLLS